MSERAEGFWWVRWANQGPDWEPALFKGGRLYSFLGCGSSVSLERAEGRLDWQPPIVEWGPYLGTEPLPLIEPPRPQMAQPRARRMADWAPHMRDLVAGVTVIDPDDVLRRDERAKERERIAWWLVAHEHDEQFWGGQDGATVARRLAAAIEAMGDEQ
jgi:hypothetical protein